MQRRDALRVGATLAGVSLAGCLDAFAGESAWRDLVVDRPDAVYVTPKIDEMWTIGIARADEYALALTATVPHGFWTVTGEVTNRTALRSTHSMHLMVSVWDPQTGVALPADVAIDIRTAGESVERRTLWPMLSQRMGVHYGDNVTLAGDGTYRATIRVGPVHGRSTGRLEDRFETPATATVEFDYADDEIEALDVTVLDRRGEPGAAEPMDTTDRGGGDAGRADHGGNDRGHDGHRVPTSTAPQTESLPGTVVGTGQSGDAEFVVALVGDEPRFDEGHAYLAVSARTPYNRIALPMMSVSATIVRSRRPMFDGPLYETTDHELGHHYGTVVDSLDPGDGIRITVESPPQIARHEGYETAFFEMSPVDIVVSE